MLASTNPFGVCARMLCYLVVVVLAALRAAATGSGVNWPFFARYFCCSRRARCAPTVASKMGRRGSKSAQIGHFGHFSWPPRIFKNEKEKRNFISTWFWPKYIENWNLMSSYCGKNESKMGLPILYLSNFKIFDLLCRYVALLWQIWFGPDISIFIKKVGQKWKGVINFAKQN